MIFIVLGQSGTTGQLFFNTCGEPPEGCECTYEEPKSKFIYFKFVNTEIPKKTFLRFREAEIPQIHAGVCGRWCKTLAIESGRHELKAFLVNKILDVWIEILLFSQIF